jgi:hypothetical protein
VIIVNYLFIQQKDGFNLLDLEKCDAIEKKTSKIGARFLKDGLYCLIRYQHER